MLVVAQDHALIRLKKQTEVAFIASDDKGINEPVAGAVSPKVGC